MFHSLTMQSTDGTEIWPIYPDLIHTAHLEGWDMLYKIHFMLCTTFVTQHNNAEYITRYITCTQICYITIKNVIYTQIIIIYTNKYNTLYKNKSNVT